MFIARLQHTISAIRLRYLPNIRSSNSILSTRRNHILHWFPQGNTRYSIYLVSRSRWYSLFQSSSTALSSYMRLSLPLIFLGAALIETTAQCQSTNNDINELCEIAAKGDFRTLQTMVEKIPQDKQETMVNRRHLGGWTALHAAVANNHTEIIEYLINKGADVNMPDMYVYTPHTYRHILEDRHNFCHRIKYTSSCTGFTALHYAFALGYEEAAKLLLEHGADTSIKTGNSQTPDKMIEFNRGNSKLMESLTKLFNDAVSKKNKIERIKFPMEEKLRQLMVGQLMPILSVSAALRRRDNGWHDEGKPLVFLFLGSSGVGKTMMAKLVAEHLTSSNPDGFIRIDCSEYGAKHEMARLIGSPPGYIGHDQGGQLTTKLQKCPNAIVLLDEVEKAHPDMLTLMLQVFDEGRLTDGQGTTISCPNAVFIMTSNLVQDEIREYQEDYNLRPPAHADKGQGSSVESLQTPTMLRVATQTNRFLENIVHPKLKRHFKRDEFLGRINEMVVFHPFRKEDLNEIVSMELNAISERAKKKHDIICKWTDQVVTSLADGYNERFGFRSIKYGIQRRLINVLAQAHERDQLPKGCTVELDMKLEDLPRFEEDGEDADIGPREKGKLERVIISEITT